MHASLTDVAGLSVGHTGRQGRGWRTGTTVVLVPGGAVAGVDVRGGGPGTHETDLLGPAHLVHHVHAVCLTGGSAYGLAAATGVMLELERRGVGFPVGSPGFTGVVPIVPAAVIYDLGRGGTFAHRPDVETGRRAVRAARRSPPAEGAVGAGTGAVAGGLQGGVGTAAVQVEPLPAADGSTPPGGGATVAALAVVNALGSVVDPASALPWEQPAGPAALRLRRPPRDERDALAAHLARLRAPLAGDEPSSLNTTIGVVATSAALTKAECGKLASVAHDGLARAVRPAHGMFDGDTVFALATGTEPVPSPTDAHAARARAAWLDAILRAGAECFAAACTRAVITATSWPGGPPAYRDLCPSAFPAGFGSAVTRR